MGHLIIIGYMGSGKSAVGERLAASLEKPFIELDEWAEALGGKSIPEIFEEEGEQRFRELETDALEKALEEQDAVIATGGGTPCNERRIALLKEYGTLFFLEVAPGILAERLQDETASRPKLEYGDPEWIARHLEERRPFYERADHKIEAGDNGPEWIAEQILNIHLR